jgi:hypothetical protein
MAMFMNASCVSSFNNRQALNEITVQETENQTILNCVLILAHITTAMLAMGVEIRVVVVQRARDGECGHIPFLEI